MSVQCIYVDTLPLAERGWQNLFQVKQTILLASSDEACQLPHPGDYGGDPAQDIS